MTSSPDPGPDSSLATRQRVQGECQGHQVKVELGSVFWLRNCQESRGLDPEGWLGGRAVCKPRTSITVDLRWL